MHLGGLLQTVPSVSGQNHLKTCLLLGCIKLHQSVNITQGLTQVITHGVPYQLVAMCHLSDSQQLLVGVLNPLAVR